MKKRHFLASALLLATLSFSVQANVMMEMFQMKKQTNALTQAATAQEFQASAKAFLEQAELAKNKVPASLEGEDEARVKGYQAGMQEVIDVVKQADELAKQGKLDEAKATVSQLDTLRKQYHKEYK